MYPQYPQKKGDKFQSGNLVLSVNFFIDRDGNIYPTLKKALSKAKIDDVCVINNEYNGGTYLKECKKL